MRTVHTRLAPRDPYLAGEPARRGDFLRAMGNSAWAADTVPFRLGHAHMGAGILGKPDLVWRALKLSWARALSCER